MFCTKLFVTHKFDKNWHFRYLTDKDSRLTSYVDKISQSTAIGENYAEVYRKYIIENKLLYRVKAHFPKKECIVLLNVWDSEESYNQFGTLVNAEKYFEIFNTVNLNYVLEKIHNINILNIIEESLSWNNCLIQYIHPDYNRDKKIQYGDPLKKRT